MGVFVKTELRWLKNYAKKLHHRAQIHKRLATLIASGIIRRVRQQRISPKSQRAQVEGGKTLIDTGRMLKSVRVAIATNDEAVVMAGGGDVKYAAIHHYGGVIRGNLTIPVFRIPRSKRARMNLRVADVVEDKGTGPRGGKVLIAKYPKVVEGARVFWFRSRKGNVLLVAKKGKRLFPLFVLKHRVKIPARHWFEIDAMTRLKIRRAVDKWLNSNG